MPTYAKRMQGLVAAYRAAGWPWPASTEQMASWAVRENKWLPPTAVLIKQCARDFADAMRQENLTDAQRRIVRAKYPATVDRNGERITLWDDVRTASRPFMVTHFAQRRQSVVADCRKMRFDLDSYNENRNPGAPIQMSFNFERDLEEGEMDQAA